MAFDPVALAERFEHAVVADAEAAAKHADVKAVLLTAAQALLPGVDLPQDEEDVTAFLKAAGDIVHRAIDAATRKTEATVSTPPAVATPVETPVTATSVAEAAPTATPGADPVAPGVATPPAPAAS